MGVNQKIAEFPQGMRKKRWEFHGVAPSENWYPQQGVTKFSGKAKYYTVSFQFVSVAFPWRITNLDDRGHRI